MSIIKKYEDFKINEELFGLTKAEKIDRRMKNLQDSLDRYLPIWIRKKAINVPTKYDLDKFWEDAKKDDYLSGDIVGGSGGVGISADKKIIYRDHSKVRTKGVGLEGVTESIYGVGDPINDPLEGDSEDESGVEMSRDEIIEILSSATEFDHSDLEKMSDDELDDLWDKMEMDDWLEEIDEEEEMNRRNYEE